MSVSTKKTIKTAPARKHRAHLLRKPQAHEEDNYEQFINKCVRGPKDNEVSIFWYYTYIGEPEERFDLATMFDELCYYHVTSGVLDNAHHRHLISRYGPKLTETNSMHHGLIVFREKRSFVQVLELLGSNTVQLFTVKNLPKVDEYVRSTRAFDSNGTLPYISISFSCPVYNSTKLLANV